MTRRQDVARAMRRASAKPRGRVLYAEYGVYTGAGSATGLADITILGVAHTDVPIAAGLSPTAGDSVIVISSQLIRATVVAVL